ncbi:hypothetical protein BHE74_00016977 [Ensete ventricosum]|nr:hypothetical protein BHE74_00016977 [Ensete ventricosum]RZR94402.1 hypothetical protein BHM03_00023081 [Ensete ventricosum]
MCHTYDLGSMAVIFINLIFDDRAFMETHLLAFKEKNPQLEVVTELIRGQHPHLKGSYSKISIIFGFSTICIVVEHEVMN